MKVLIGYDGSEGGSAAIAELARAGIPHDSELRVVTAADVWPHLPAESYAPMEAASLAELPVMVQRAHVLAKEAMREAMALSEQGAQRVKESMPQMAVTAAAMPDSPSEGLVRQSEEWAADLVMVGAVSRSRLERLMLGSVSQGVLAHAPCSVRICRAGTSPRREGLRLMVGVDGSLGAANAIEAIASRQWPRETQVYVMTALDARLATMVPQQEHALLAGEDDIDGVPAWIRAMGEGAADELRRAGLMAEAVFPEGEPKELLIEGARSRAVDCIFVGARGHSGLSRLLLGSVSQTVAARATCSVEVVRA